MITRTRFIITVVVALLVGVAIFAGLAAGPTRDPIRTARPEPTSVDVPVSITADGFTPATATVALGHAVIWRNNDNKPHRITPVPAAPYINTSNLDQPKSPEIAPGETYRFVFHHTLSVAYYDGSNAAVTGTIVVQSPQSKP